MIKRIPTVLGWICIFGLGFCALFVGAAWIKAQHDKRSYKPEDILYSKPYHGPLPRADDQLTKPFLHPPGGGFDIGMFKLDDGEAYPIYGLVKKVEPAGTLKQFLRNDSPLWPLFTPISCDDTYTPETEKQPRCGQSTKMSLVLCGGSLLYLKNCQRVFISGIYERKSESGNPMFPFYKPGSEYYFPTDADVFDPEPMYLDES